MQGLLNGFQSDVRYDIVISRSIKKEWNGQNSYNVNDGDLIITLKTSDDRFDIIKTTDTGFFILFPSPKIPPASLRSTIAPNTSVVQHFLTHPSTADRYISFVEDQRSKRLYEFTFNDAKLFAAICFLHGLGLRRWRCDPFENMNVSMIKLTATTLMRRPYKILTEATLKPYFDQIAPIYMTSFRWIDHFAQQLHGKRINEEEFFTTRVQAAIIDALQNEEMKGHTWSHWNDLKSHVQRTLHRLEEDIELVYSKSSNSLSFSVYRANGALVKDTFQRSETRRSEQFILDKVRSLHESKTKAVPVDPLVLERVLSMVFHDECQRDPFQVQAIKNALLHPISVVSGPPGSGKTSCVIQAIVLYYEIKYADEQQSINEKSLKRQLTDQLKYSTAKQMLSKTYKPSDVLNNDDSEDNDNDDESGFDTVLRRKYTRLHRQFTRAPTSLDTSLVKLTAPSGVAARRLATACSGRTTHTCHAFLYQLIEDQSEMKRAKLDKVDRDFYPFKLWVIDEASMIDLDLFKMILKAADHEQVALLFVGDANQLPPIGSGQVFQDLIEQQLLPSTQLQNIYRQGTGSSIAKLSKTIMTQKANLPSLTHLAEISNDIRATIISEVANTYTEHVINIWRSYRQEHPHWKVQVLTPMNDGAGGRKELNVALQAARCSDHTYQKFCEGDPVIHLQNNYKLDLRNGDIGHIVSANYALESLPDIATNIRNNQIELHKLLFVQFSHKIQVYSKDATAINKQIADSDVCLLASTKDLDLAYAITAHKSQGSEYDAVILVLPRLGPSGFVCDKLMNTMVSRAKFQLHIVAPESLWLQACQTRYVNRRTRLNNRSIFE